MPDPAAECRMTWVESPTSQVDLVTRCAACGMSLPVTELNVNGLVAAVCECGAWTQIVVQMSTLRDPAGGERIVDPMWTLTNA